VIIWRADLRVQMVMVEERITLYQRRELHEAKIPDSVVHYRRRCNCNT